MNPRTLAQIQHAIQYPAGHLDRFAQFGPTFEMSADSPDPRTIAEAYVPMIQAQRNQSTSVPAAATDEHPIGAANACKQFILAGKAIFTLQGKGSRYTFRVNRAEPKPDSQYTQPAYFVSLLTGPDNLQDYTYVGLLTVHDGQIRITRSSKYRDDSQPVRAFNWAMGRIWRGLPIEPAVFYHVGRCARCGRALTVPSSIETGFGPECAGKLGE